MLTKVVVALGLLLLVALAWLIGQANRAPFMCERCGKVLVEDEVCSCVDEVEEIDEKGVN